MKVVMMSSSVAIIALGVALFLADRHMFQHLNWFQPDVLARVNTFRYSIVFLQFGFVTFTLIYSTKKEAIRTAVFLVSLLAICTGVALSVLGWLKLDSLLRDLAIFGQ